MPNTVLDHSSRTLWEETETEKRRLSAISRAKERASFARTGELEWQKTLKAFGIVLAIVASVAVIAATIAAAVFVCLVVMGIGFWVCVGAVILGAILGLFGIGGGG